MEHDSIDFVDSDTSVEIKYKIRDFIPLIIIFLLILAFTLYMFARSDDRDGFYAVRVFMGSFFVVFGAFKASNLSGFAKAYQMYDILAIKSRAYAMLYPFLELGLGVAYLFSYELFIVNWITLIIMLLGATGVWIKLRKREKIACACLGAVFKVPMTYVTLAEDLLMAGMAFWMLFIL